MKSNFKRVMSIVLTVLMVMTVVPFGVFAADSCEHNFCGEIFDRVEGKHAYWCIECNLEYGYIDEEGNQIEGLVDCSGSEATCSERAFCYGCNREFGDYDYEKHDYSVADKTYLARKATCQSPAEYFYSCSYCGDCEYDYEHTYFKGTADTVGGHISYEAASNGDGTHDIERCYLCEEEVLNAPCVAGEEATCSEQARCEYCNAKFGEFDADNHANYTWIDYKEATCQEAGHYGYDYCNACNNVIDEIEYIEKLEHTYTEFEKDADADTHSKYCTTCDETVGEVSVITEPCSGGTADCTTKATCEVCNAVYGDVKHTWNAGEVTTVPTCSATGVKTYTCTVDGCDATKTETLAVVEGAHNWGTELHKDANNKHYVVCANNAEHKQHTDCAVKSSTVTAPTCDEDGYTTYVCECGNTWTGEPTTAIGHSFTKTEVKPEYLATQATCVAKATYYKSCANCGEAGTETFESGELAAHAFTEAIKDEAHLKAAATCVTKAVYWYDCANCDVIASDETVEANYYTDEESELLPHVYELEVVDEKYLAVPATCSTKAIYYKSCACGASGKDSEVEVVFETGEALGHIVETIPGKDPTCTEDGYTESRVCKRPTADGKTCGAVLKAQVKRPATGHKEYVSVEKVEANCVKVGHTEEKKCAVCEQLLTLPSITTPALGHVDDDGDEICDRTGCGTIVVMGTDCSCLCHQTGFMRIIYVLIRLIWKLIGANPYCDCGVEHY